MTVDCTRARQLLHPWLDGELERDEHREIVEHLGLCERCDARFKDEQRLLARVKSGLAAPCPSELRAKLFCAIAAAAPARGRNGIVFMTRFAAAAAVLVVAFVWTDPICLRGCPTVRALALEHKDGPATVTSSVAEAVQLMADPFPECARCSGLACLGWDRVRCCKTGCMIHFKDAKGRAISFVKMKDGHVHRWLMLHADPSGLILTNQDGCRFAGWREPDGDLCAFLADETVDSAELVSLSTRARQ